MCFSRLFIQLPFLVFTLFSSVSMAEIIYKTPLEQADWKYTGSVFSCDISHEINSLWEMRLTALPGDVLEFSVLGDEKLIKDKYLELSVTPPSWSEVKYQKKAKFYNDADSASTHLYSGKLLEALTLGWQWQVDISDENALLYRLSSSPLYTQELAKKFFKCRRKLLPKPFNYVKNLDLLFDEGSEKLRAQSVEDIDAVAAYIKADKSIEKVLIDGHTDSTGDDLNNMYLSQLRVDEVVARLVEQGIKTKVIEVRNHGERYPKANNHTLDGRQINRRVHIRLVKKT